MPQLVKVAGPVPTSRGDLTFVRRSFRYLSYFLLLLLAPNHLLASPTVSSVDLNRSTFSISISGAGFGSQSSSFSLSDTVDDVLFREQSVSTTSPIYEDLWQRYGTTWAEPLIPRISRSRAASLRGKVYYGGPGRANNSYYKPISDRHARSLYVSWLYHPSAHPGSAGGSNKFIRIWDNHNGNDTRISWTQMHMTYSGGEKASWSAWNGKVKDWNLMEIYVDSDSNSIKTWVNGSLAHNVNDFVKKSQTEGLNVRQLGFDPSIGDNYPNFELEIDNVYVAESPARVVISEEQKWADARSAGESLVPLAWDSTKIVAQVPEYRAASTSSFYVFVVHADRSVNELGYRVCPKCPEEPTLSLD